MGGAFECAGDRDNVVLRVLDSVPALGLRLEDRLFEPFATSRPEGVGLGLAVAKKIAEGGTAATFATLERAHVL